MKIALMSDLHANRQAVEAVWQHAQERGFDQLVMLGDYVDYGADPVWVVEFAQAREAEGAVLVRGNHDDALSAETTSKMSAHVGPSLAWTFAQLSPAQRDRSEEHTSELQSQSNLVCRLLL